MKQAETRTYDEKWAEEAARFRGQHFEAVGYLKARLARLLEDAHYAVGRGQRRAADDLLLQVTTIEECLITFGVPDEQLQELRNAVGCMVANGPLRS